MDRITENYADFAVADLLEEVSARKGAGSPNFDDIKSNTAKADIVSSLELDDEHVASNPGDLPIVKSGGKSVEIPNVTVSPVADVSCPPPPADELFTFQAKRLSDGMLFAVCVHEPDTYGKTVTCKNSALFWQGDQKQFREFFDKI